MAQKKTTSHGFVGDHSFGRIKTFTRVPKRLEAPNGVEYDFEALVLDPRNWPDRKEQTVFQQVFRQLASVTVRANEQRAVGRISLNAISKATGMDSRTIQKHLFRLQERKLLTVTRLKGSGNPPPYRVALNLDFGQWQGIKHYHTIAPDDEGASCEVPWEGPSSEYAQWW